MAPETPGKKSPQNARWFREVLGHYPTGVSLVTAIDGSNEPVGMIVGTFTSVSLDPPLIAFLPSKTSSTWPKIHQSGKFCVNVLGASQEAYRRIFIGKSENRFRDVDWFPAPSGNPVIEGCIAWMDCELSRIVEAGDHYIAIGEVLHLETEEISFPLVFFRSQFGQFRPLSDSAE